MNAALANTKMEEMTKKWSYISQVKRIYNVTFATARGNTWFL
jgi:hypothetical protein